MDDDSNDNTESLQVTDNQKGGRGMEMEEEPEAESADSEVQLMGIDQAILHSIDKCGQCIYCILYTCEHLGFAHSIVIGNEFYFIFPFIFFLSIIICNSW